MKKTLLIVAVLLIGGRVGAAELPSFPMSIYGSIKLGSTDLSSGVIKVYDGNNTQIADYIITKAGKYGSENVFEPVLMLPEFTGKLSFRVVYNGTTYTVDSSQIDDTQRGAECPPKSEISFLSRDCRYDIVLVESKPSGGGGGGGGSSLPAPDIGVSSGVTESGSVASGTVESLSFTGDPDKSEIENAYDFAHFLGLTTMSSLEEARVYDPITRAEFAKVISNYAKVIGKDTKNVDTQCDFTDLDQVNTELAGFSKLSCQYGLMGQGITAFRPNDRLSRAEIVTVISRLYGRAQDGAGDVAFYTYHMQAMQHKGYITVDDPDMAELRGYIFIMLQRIGFTE